MSNSARATWILLSGMAIYVAIAAYYMPYLTDDALISLRYAERFAQGDGLTWNDGYYVEGYSNFAWVVLLGGLIKLGVGPIFALRLLGAFFVGAVAIAGLRLTARSAAPFAASLLLVLVMAVHPLWIWTIAGLETPLVVACIFFALLALDKWWQSERENSGSLWLASAILALLTLTRPDAPLFTVAAAFLPLFGSEPFAVRIRNAIILVSLPLMAFALQMGFRLYYYGDWVPNTARVKVALNEGRLRSGAKYVLSAIYVASAGVAIIGALSLWRPRQRPAVFWLALFMGGVWAGYIVVIGGDHFPGLRHLPPTIAALAAAMVIARNDAPVAWLDAAMRRAPVIALMAAVLVMAGYTIMQARYDWNARVHTRSFVWSCQEVAQDMYDQFNESDPMIAVTAAGCLPYFTGFETLDLLGLNDLEIPKRKPEDFGKGWLGHELGDIDYVLERQPQIIIFHMGEGPIFRYIDLIENSDAFHRDYCETAFESGGEQRKIFMQRSYREKIGFAGLCENDDRLFTQEQGQG